MHNKRIEFFQVGMLALNCVAVMSICIFIHITTCNVLDHYNARNFLSSVSATPRQPMRNAVWCAFCMGFLVCTFVMRRTTPAANSKLIYASFVSDLAVSCWCVFMLNFNYNGILLYVFANVVAYTKGKRLRYAFVMAAVICFLTSDYELISIYFPLYSLRDYIVYYEAGVQSYLLSIYNVISSMNIILFILYCIFVIFRQQGTIEEVNVLYQRLSEANRDMEAANKQLQEYAAITEKMGETRERNRLAREIHDTLGHTLTGISAGIDACLTTLEQSPDATRRQLEAISRVTREGISDVRRSVHTLRADAAEHISLEHAISRMITDMRALTDAKIYFVKRVDNLQLSRDEENAIFRVIQESLTNAMRHGKASEIWVELKVEARDVVLIVEDNGVGCAEITSGFGMRHIRERIEMLGGSVTFDGSTGFKVSGRIPMRWRSET